MPILVISDPFKVESLQNNIYKKDDLVEKLFVTIILIENILIHL